MNRDLVSDLFTPFGVEILLMLANVSSALPGPGTQFPLPKFSLSFIFINVLMVIALITVESR